MCRLFRVELETEILLNTSSVVLDLFLVSKLVCIFLGGFVQMNRRGGFPGNMRRGGANRKWMNQTLFYHPPNRNKLLVFCPVIFLEEGWGLVNLSPYKPML